MDVPEATEEEDVFRKAEKALREYFTPQRKNYEFDGLKEVINISDDILVFGVDDADHDANLEAALERIIERGLTLNKEKYIFKKRNLIFQGYLSSEHGIVPDPAKVTAIRELTTPKDVSGVRSLLGMTNFCCRFIKNYVTLTEPLRELTKKGIYLSYGPRESIGKTTSCPYQRARKRILRFYQGNGSLY